MNGYYNKDEKMMQDQNVQFSSYIFCLNEQPD